MGVLIMAIQIICEMISAIVGGISIVSIMGIIAVTILLFAEKITIADLKELFKKDKWK